MMRRKKTSVFYFTENCTKVWEAVTSKNENNGFTFSPMSDEEYERKKQEALSDGKALAQVTDLTPGVSCAYELHAEKFDVFWSARFETVGDGECRMVMTETYQFHRDAVPAFLLSLLFLRQRRQHRDFRDTIGQRLESMNKK